MRTGHEMKFAVRSFMVALVFFFFFFSPCFAAGFALFQVEGGRGVGFGLECCGDGGGGKVEFCSLNKVSIY